MTSSPTPADPDATAHHAATAAVPAPSIGITPLGALLTSHILRDGETVLLVLKPSLWFIPIISLIFSGSALLAAALAALIDHRNHDRAYFKLAGLLIAARLAVALLQWLGRLYVLTDLRLVRMSGIFNVDVYDLPLRRVARTELSRTFRERCVLAGTIAITPQDPQMQAALWQTISRPVLVHEQLVAAINKAQQGTAGD